MRLLFSLTIMSLLFKDLFSMVKVFFPWLSFLSLVPALFLLFLFFCLLPRLVNARLVVLDLFFLAYLMLDLLFFVASSFLGGGQSYGFYYLVVSFFYFTLLPFVIYFSARLFPELYIESVKLTFACVLPLVLGVCLAQFVWVGIDKELVADFMMRMYGEGVISYPLQTHADGYEIRLQGIFYSSFALAIFLLFSASVIADMQIGWRVKGVLFVVLGFVFFYSYNRNGILAFFAFMLLYFLSFFRIGMFLVLRRVFPFLCVLFLLFSIALPGLSGFLNFDSADSSAITKVSTLLSRFETWGSIINERRSDLLFGVGYVQGLAIGGEETLMVDNLFLSKSLQSGIFSATILFVFLGWLGFCANTELRGVAILYCVSILMFSLNNVFGDINYTVLVLGFFVASVFRPVENGRVGFANAQV